MESEEGSGWWGWVKETGAAAAQALKEDFGEVVTVVSTDTSEAAAIAAETVVEKATEVAGTATTLLDGIDDVAAAAAQPAGPDRFRSTWLQQQECQLRRDEKTFTTDPAASADSMTYVEWLESFQFADQANQTAELLQESPDLLKFHIQMVPEQMSNEIFWTRYFWQCKKVELDADRRAALVERAAQDAEEDEEDGWGDWEDDDIALPTSQENSTETVTAATQAEKEAEAGTDGVDVLDGFLNSPLESPAPNDVESQEGAQVSSPSPAVPISTPATPTADPTPETEADTPEWGFDSPATPSVSQPSRVNVQSVTPPAMSAPPSVSTGAPPSSLQGMSVPPPSTVAPPSTTFTMPPSTFTMPPPTGATMPPPIGTSIPPPSGTTVPPPSGFTMPPKFVPTMLPPTVPTMPPSLGTPSAKPPASLGGSVARPPVIAPPLSGQKPSSSNSSESGGSWDEMSKEEATAPNTTKVSENNDDWADWE